MSSTTLYRTKTFPTLGEFRDFLNYGGGTLLASGTGYVDGSNVFHAVTSSVADFDDIDGQGTAISGVIVLTGGNHSDVFRLLGAVVDADSVNVGGHTQQGSPADPVKFKIFDQVPTFEGTIIHTSQSDETISVVWSDTHSNLHF